MNNFQIFTGLKTKSSEHSFLFTSRTSNKWKSANQLGINLNKTLRNAFTIITKSEDYIMEEVYILLI